MVSATAAEIADRPASEAEIDRLNADVLVRMRDRASAPAPSEARAPKPRAAAPEPEDASAAPAPDWSWLPADSAAHQYKDPTLKSIVALQEPLYEALNDVAEAISKLRKENTALQLELAQLRAEHAETKGKLGEASHKLDRLTITHKGDRGERGAQGADGQPGPIGPVGQTGARGSRGQPGDRIVSWRLAPGEFLAFPITETGKELPPLNLMPFFTEYDGATEASEVELASEQTALSRARLELETERVRRGLPAK